MTCTRHAETYQSVVHDTTPTQTPSLTQLTIKLEGTTSGGSRCRRCPSDSTNINGRRIHRDRHPWRRRGRLLRSKLTMTMSRGDSLLLSSSQNGDLHKLVNGCARVPLRNLEGSLIDSWGESLPIIIHQNLLTGYKRTER